MLADLSLREYYKGWGVTRHILSAFVISTPLISGLLPEQWSSLVFPPLGENQFTTVAKAFSILFCVITSILVYYARNNPSVISGDHDFRLVLWPTIFFFAAFCSYSVAWQRFVVITPGERTEVVEGKSINISVIETVSIGYETSSAVKNNPELQNLPDYFLVRTRPRTEENIRYLYTFKSIIVARLLLFSSCLAVMCSAIVLISIISIINLRKVIRVKEREPVVEEVSREKISKANAARAGH
jgi:hypothetical protein